jgi:hypothetical protein
VEIVGALGWVSGEGKCHARWNHQLRKTRSSPSQDYRKQIGVKTASNIVDRNVISLGQGCFWNREAKHNRKQISCYNFVYTFQSVLMQGRWPFLDAIKLMVSVSQKVDHASD